MLSAIINGFSTGLILQIAVGPVFFYIISISIQRTNLDGLFSVLAVTLVDYLYIFLAIAGIGKLLENEKRKKISGIISGIVLAVFGTLLLFSTHNQPSAASSLAHQSNYFNSFISVFLLTISSPLTIVFWMGVFATKTIENNYTGKELVFFGIAAGMATFIFLGMSVFVIGLLKTSIPVIIVKGLNIFVGILLICYGFTRSIKVLKTKPGPGRS